MRTNRIAPALLTAALLITVTSPILFSPQAIMSGDAPLWSIRYLAGIFPGYAAGYWDNLFFTGYAVPGTLLTPQRLLLPWLDPAVFIKWILFSSVLLTAAATWFWMRAQGRTPLAAACTGIGLALSGHYFTMISAGHIGKLIMFPMIIGALACIETAFRKNSLLAFAWCGALLALAIGEQPDVTLMTGMLPAALILFKTFSAENPAPLKNRLGFTLAGGTIAVICLLVTATPALIGQFDAHVKEIAPTQENESSVQKWDWATQWSLPPEDTLELIVPSPLGTKSGDAKLPYWGRQGRTPGWEQSRTGFRNFRQEEQYTGIVFLFFAGLALAGLRKGSQSRSRSAILFWSVSALVFYLLALGRYAFLYRIFYALPFADSMRNPVKFMFALLLCLGALSGYGIDAFLESGKREKQNRTAKISAGLGGVFLFAALCLAAGHSSITGSLTAAGWGDYSAALSSNLIFSSFYAGLMLLLAAGWIAGLHRIKSPWFALLLPVLIAVDAGYIDNRHVDSYDAEAGNQGNEVTAFLKKQEPAPRIKLLSRHPLFQYWSNTTLPFNGIQQIDVLAESRLPQDKAFFTQALSNNPLRYWQITSTRFSLTDQATWRSLKNNPAWKTAFTPIYPFTIEQTAGSLQTSAVKDPNTAPFLLLKVNGALPRAVLYPHWDILPDEQAVGRRLATPSFNPEKTVLLSGPKAPVPANDTAQPYITPAITCYSPHRIDITLPPQPEETVLLLNDRYDKNWTATVDGNPVKILRGNYLMRAVSVPPESRSASFIYKPDTRPVFLALTALLLLTLASVSRLFFRRRTRL